ncbi:YfiR family protein [Oleiharenicola lentus]|uniref:YfiR family protein n=1 Tax=Oleiharenicola lentus TaxID=2508720 RepID=UPI003F673636
MAFLSSSLKRAIKALGWFAVAGLLILATPLARAASADYIPEYQLKSVFLFNFAQFVEWPEQSFKDAESPLVIGIWGDDPFGSYLDDLVKNEKVGAHVLVVRRFRRAEEIQDCHILFVSKSVSGQAEKVFPMFAEKPLLTVGDVDNFSRLGGMVRFATESGKIRLRINVDASKKAGLTISSKLLRWATIVTPERG